AVTWIRASHYARSYSKGKQLISRPGPALSRTASRLWNGKKPSTRPWGSCALSKSPKLSYRTAIHDPTSFVYLAEGMIDPAPGTPARAVSSDSSGSSGEEFVRAFNELRTELVSSLYFQLGDFHDAQDAVQEAFLKCWRLKDTLPDIRNMRA